MPDGQCPNIVVSYRFPTFLYFIFNCKIITLQYYDVFCHISTWNNHRYTYVLFLLYPPPTSLPCPIAGGSVFFKHYCDHICSKPLRTLYYHLCQVQIPKLSSPFAALAASSALSITTLPNKSFLKLVYLNLLRYALYVSVSESWCIQLLSTWNTFYSPASISVSKHSTSPSRPSSRVT